VFNDIPMSKPFPKNRGNPLDAILDEDEPPLSKEAKAAQEFYDRNTPMDEKEQARQDLREAAKERMDEFWKRGLHLLYAYRGNRDMAFDCFMVGIGEGSSIGLLSAVEVAKKYRVTKSNATKCILMFQDSLGIPPMPGQRDSRGRVQMGNARKEQLK
jgi:hypothetical protein